MKGIYIVGRNDYILGALVFNKVNDSIRLLSSAKSLCYLLSTPQHRERCYHYLYQTDWKTELHINELYHSLFLPSSGPVKKLATNWDFLIAKVICKILPKI